MVTAPGTLPSVVLRPDGVTSRISNRSRSVTSALPSGRKATDQPRSTFAMSLSYSGMPPAPPGALVLAVTALLAAELFPSGSRALTVKLYEVFGVSPVIVVPSDVVVATFALPWKTS